MKLDFEGWTSTSSHERIWLWQMWGMRPLFVLWYKMGGKYLSGWTPFVVKINRPVDNTKQGSE